MTKLRFRTNRAAVVLSALLVLAACSSGANRVATAPPPAGVSVADTDVVFNRLMAGDQEGARKQLKTLLKRDPMNATARMLADSVERDPKDLLGPESFPYTARPGDTIVSLAQRFLGNRLKAYQLLRYNGLNAPALLTPGQLLRVPGETPKVEPFIKRPEPAPVRTSPDRTKPTAAKPVPPAAPATNPAAARQARAAGLAALNQGNVARAVGMLRRAAALDPGNPAITRDLARAERIAATVRARK